MEKFGLEQKSIQIIRAILDSYPQIKKVILYGSRAKGNYKKGSDIDITLVAPELNMTDLLRIENQLDDLLLPQKIDLSLLHKIENQSLIDHIQRVGIDFQI